MFAWKLHDEFVFFESVDAYGTSLRTFLHDECLHLIGPRHLNLLMSETGQHNNLRHPFHLKRVLN